MADDKELQEMAGELEKALEQESEAPRLSIDPDTKKPAVVGDPTLIPEKKGTYTLTFGYPPEEVSEEDKLRMKKHAKTGYYTAQIKYEGIFIKPLYRAKIAEIMTRVLADANIIDLEGYTSKVQTEMYGASFLKNNDDICEVIKMMLKVPDEQLEYLMPLEPGRFVVQFMQNEPNFVKEANNFLS